MPADERAQLKQGVSPLRGAGLSRFASSHRGTGVSPLDGLPSLTQHGQAGRAG